MMNRSHTALSLAPMASAARPCAQAHLLGAEFGVVAANTWSTNPMSLKRTGYSGITARSRRSRRRPT